MDTILIEVSNKMMQLPFNGCEEDYIYNVCKGQCCQHKKIDKSIIVDKMEEVNLMYKYKVKIKDGFLQPENKKCKTCPFKTEESLCKLHHTNDKPFGCVSSPFALNKNDMLIVNNRYKLLKCYNDGKRLPAYKAFRGALNFLFGEVEAERLCYYLEHTSSNIHSPMPFTTYKTMLEHDRIKKATP
jgi:hypothetical protein